MSSGSRTDPMQTNRSIITRLGLALASLALAAVLVIGFKAPDPATAIGAVASNPGTGPTGSGSGSPATTSPGSTAGATAAPGPTTAAASGTRTATGTLIDTFYGPVQVQVTVTNGKVTSIVAVALPTGGRSGRIAQYAEPILQGEALAAQSANIDFVSGATYTSDGYQRSLQSALDQIHA
jgi:uncharacterized protein with FMN-binding domain